MKKKRPRVEIQPKPWVRDPGKWPFGKIILPPEPTPVRRVMLSATMLAKALRCPRDLVAAFLRQGQLHEASRGEIAGGLGLCAEDLASLALGGMLCTRYNLRLASLALVTIGDLWSELLNAPRPKRVMLAVLRANERIEAHVGTTDSGPLRVWDVTGDQTKATDFYDASDLRDRIDGALPLSPLVIPSAESCLVSRPRGG